MCASKPNIGGMLSRQSYDPSCMKVGIDSADIMDYAHCSRCTCRCVVHTTIILIVFCAMYPVLSLSSKFCENWTSFGQDIELCTL